MSMPTIRDVSLDPQRDALYWAESYTREIVGDGTTLPADGLTGYVERVLAAAGWQVDEPPTFIFDVTDSMDLTAWHEGRTRAIHLHPQLLTEWVVLHELAHWVRPRDGHGPQFAASLIALVDAAMGPDASTELLQAFRDEGVDVDTSWLPEVLS